MHNLCEIAPKRKCKRVSCRLIDSPRLANQGEAMITWLHNATHKHHNWILGFFAAISAVSFIFFGYGDRSGRAGDAHVYLGVNLSDVRTQNRFRDSLVFGTLSGQRTEGRTLPQQIAELHLANSLAIPDPSEAEVRKIALAITTPVDGRENNNSLNLYLEAAAKQLNATDVETRARFETYIKDTWRINKAIQLLAGPGHASTAQIKRSIEREKTMWTVDVATLRLNDIKTDVKVDEAKAQAYFEANKEAYRLPAKVELTLVALPNVTPDTSPITDEEIVTEAYNLTEQLKFETGKVKEQALARRKEVERIIHQDRALRNLAGKIGEELADQFPTDVHAANSPAFQAWLKKQNPILETLPAFDVTNPPANKKVPAEVLKLAADLTEKDWRTDMFRTEDAAIFLILNKRIESRLPEFTEVKDNAIANWQRNERTRLLNEETNRINKTIQADAAAGKDFKSSAKALGLSVSSPAPFNVNVVPAELIGINESTSQAIEVANVGKITPGILTANGDTVFIRPSHADKPKDDATADEVKQLIERFSARNANYTAMGLFQDLTTTPEQQGQR